MTDFLISLFIFMLLHPIIIFICCLFILNLLSFKYDRTWFMIYEEADHNSMFVNVRVIYKTTLFKIYWTKPLKSAGGNIISFNDDDEINEAINKYKHTNNKRFFDLKSEMEPKITLIKIVE